MVKRKKRKTNKKPVIQECCGYRLGDVVYAKTVTDRIRHGAITAFYPNNDEGPAFTFMEYVDSKYCTTLIEWIIDKPTVAQKKKALKSR